MTEEIGQKQNKKESSNDKIFSQERREEKDMGSDDANRMIDEERKQQIKDVSEFFECIDDDDGQELFIPKGEVLQVNQYLLRYIQNFTSNENHKFDKFVHSSLLELIYRFMESSKKMANDLNMKTIDFKQRGGSLLLIHPDDSQMIEFITTFHETAEKMYNQGSLNKMDQKFIDFYIWVEDAREQVIRYCVDDGLYSPSNFPETHQLAKQLRELKKQEELNQELQKKPQIQDDIGISLFAGLQKTFHSIIELLVKIATCVMQRQYSDDSIQCLFKYVSEVAENENALNELIRQQNESDPEAASKYKSLREFVFQQTFATQEILYYIQVYNDKKKLNIDTKELDSFFNQTDYPCPEGFFERFRLYLREFMQKANSRKNEAESQ